MNFENCKYFIAAAEELNFTQAAKKLFMTQQALSKQIDKIEKAYNVRLFNREPPMSLTEAGECLYRHMCRLMDDERQMRRELDSLREAKNSLLTIGVSALRSQALLPPILSVFCREHPKTKVRIVENNLSKIVEELKLGKVEMIFGYEQLEDPALVSRWLLEERVVFVLPKTLAAEVFSDVQIKKLLEAGSASLIDFAHCPFLRFSEFTWLGKHFDECCKKEGITPPVVLDASNVLTLLRCCLEGMGAALVPDLYLRNMSEEERQTVYILPWDYMATRCNGAVLYLKRSYMSEVALDFIKTAQQVYGAAPEKEGNPV